MLRRAGDTLTIDWGTVVTAEDDPRAAACACGSALCRGQVTLSDWRAAELRVRYGNHFCTELLRRMDKDDTPVGWLLPVGLHLRVHESAPAG